MTNNLNKVEGNNIFCGPAAISTITGRTTDEIERLIQRQRGSYAPVRGCLLRELERVLTSIGWKSSITHPINQTLFRYVADLKDDGYYIITLPKHFVVIYKEGNDRFFCDNHTKEPIRASSSARLMQQVVEVLKAEKDPRR